jgi:hypothetical protein
LQLADELHEAHRQVREAERDFDSPEQRSVRALESIASSAAALVELLTP